MRESVLLHEESLRLQRMCRDLKKRDHLSTFLRRAHDAALSAYTRALGDDEFGEALDPPPILGTFSLPLPACVVREVVTTAQTLLRRRRLLTSCSFA
jgi:hypothetical protein